jgi:hypothetical protein
MKERDRNPARAIGVFLIVLGLMMAAVIFDVLNLGDRDEYFKWQILVIFIGLISLFSRNAVGGIIMIAVGVYFLLPEIEIGLPYIFEKVYWPTAVILVGLILVISGIVKGSGRHLKS